MPFPIIPGLACRRIFLIGFLYRNLCSIFNTSWNGLRPNSSSSLETGARAMFTPLALDSQWDGTAVNREVSSNSIQPTSSSQQVCLVKVECNWDLNRVDTIDVGALLSSNWAFIHERCIGYTYYFKILIQTPKIKKNPDFQQIPLKNHMRPIQTPCTHAESPKKSQLYSQFLSINLIHHKANPSSPSDESTL